MKAPLIIMCVVAAGIAAAGYFIAKRVKRDAGATRDKLAARGGVSDGQFLADCGVEAGDAQLAKLALAARKAIAGRAGLASDTVRAEDTFLGDYSEIANWDDCADLVVDIATAVGVSLTDEQAADAIATSQDGLTVREFIADLPRVIVAK